MPLRELRSVPASASIRLRDEFPAYAISLFGGGCCRSFRSARSSATASVLAGLFHFEKRRPNMGGNGPPGGLDRHDGRCSLDVGDYGDAQDVVIRSLFLRQLGKITGQRANKSVAQQNPRKVPTSAAATFSPICSGGPP